MTEGQEAADLQLVAELRQEAADYAKRWILWLGVGGAGGMVALLSFAANLPDPDLALKALWPSLAAFALSVLTAGPSLLLSAWRSSALADHYANASNRERANAKAAGMIEMISSPKRMADDFNAPRDRLVKQSHEFHARAEAAWTKRTVWTWLRSGAITVSSLSFVFGTAYPLYLIAADKPLTRAVKAVTQPGPHTQPQPQG